MKRFVLGTERTTAEQDKAFLDIIKDRWPNLGWWHHLSEMWLIVDLSDKLTAADLRDAATQAYPGINLLVLEAKGPGLWAGFGRADPWMQTAWDRS